MDAVGSRPKSAQVISKETLRKLAEKLKELVGEDFEMPNDQLVKEDGLPIVEFTEPVSQSQADSFRIPSPPPLKLLPKTEAERIARRKEIDAFFAALEEEERQENEKNKEKEESEFMRVIREAKEKKEEILTQENTRHNAGSLGGQHRGGRQPTESDEDEEDSIKPPSPTTKPKKAVKFANAVGESKKEGISSPSIGGDVQQGRLRRPIGVKSGGGVMKLEIIEKFPLTSKARAVDSDDEDEDASLGSDEETDEEEKNQIEIEDALDRREIALRYHEMRQSLGAGPQAGALGGTIDPKDIDEWEQENVPLDASLYGRSPGGNRSQFNGSRLSERILNAYLPNGLAGEFRNATLEKGELVRPVDGGDSDGEIGPRGKKIIEGLKKGLTVEEVIANEPNEEGKDITPTKHEVKPIKRGTALIGEVVEVQKGGSKPTQKGGMPAKISRFKANRME